MKTALVTKPDQRMTGLLRYALSLHDGLRSQSAAVEVCRPFSPLAITGRLGQHYVRLMQRAMPPWRAFDGRNTWLTRRWGWMDLASAWKRSG